MYLALFMHCRIGKKKTMLIAMLLLGTIGLGTAFAPVYYTFIALRFVVAAAATGLYMCNVHTGNISIPNFQLEILWDYC